MKCGQLGTERTLPPCASAVPVAFLKLSLLAGCFDVTSHNHHYAILLHSSSTDFFFFKKINIGNTETETESKEREETVTSVPEERREAACHLR